MPSGGSMNIVIQPWYTLIPLVPLFVWLVYGFWKEVRIYILYWRFKKLVAYGIAISFVGALMTLAMVITGVQIYQGNISW